MKTKHVSMDKNILDVVHKIEKKFDGINIEVYYSTIENVYELLIPMEYFNNSEFQIFVSEIAENNFTNNIINYYIMNRIINTGQEKVYVSPQVELV